MQVLCVSPIYNTCGSMFSFNLTQIEFTPRHTRLHNLNIFFVVFSQLGCFITFFLSTKTVLVMI